MGCSCKDKSKTNTPTPLQTVVVNSVVEIVEQPPYTAKEVIRVKDFFNNRFKTEEERNFAIEWNKQYFEPQLQGYCDASCMARIEKRAHHAYEKIMLYEQSKKSNRKTKKNS